MFQQKTFFEKIDDINIKITMWEDNSFRYISYFLPGDEYCDLSERDLIKLVSASESFSNIPQEYSRQAGIMDIDDENGEYMIELTFVLGNKD